MPPIEYPDIPLSSMAPVPHNLTDLRVPELYSREKDCPTDDHEEASSADDSEDTNTPSGAHHEHHVRERCPCYPNQDDIDELVQGMALTKPNAELLISKFCV